MNIAILGAGWSGCHSGIFLKKLGHHITIFEKNNSIFYGASGNNQFRHHNGYHYPRSLQTIKMIRKNRERFEKDYGFCLNNIENNYYGIADQFSLIDEGIYEKIFPELTPISDTIYSFTNLKRIYKTNEQGINNKIIIQYFIDQLKDHIVYNTVLEKEKYNEYDLIIDCSNNDNNNLDLIKKSYLLYVLRPSEQHAKNIFAITIMDGNFCSLYPYFTSNNEILYTLSHVKYSDLSNEIDSKQRLENTKNSIRYFYPNFDRHFSIIDSLTGIKNFVPSTKDASRMLEYKLSNNCITLSITKILSIYEIEDKLIEILS
jgi:hypothetical protein